MARPKDVRERRVASLMLCFLQIWQLLPSSGNASFASPQRASERESYVDLAGISSDASNDNINGQVFSALLEGPDELSQLRFAKRVGPDGSRGLGFIEGQRAPLDGGGDAKQVAKRFYKHKPGYFIYRHIQGMRKTRATRRPTRATRRPTPATPTPSQKLQALWDMLRQQHGDKLFSNTKLLPARA